MSQLHKKEAQSCHYNKNSYSLHCTVENVNSENRSLKSPFCYLYHLSDDMKHDFVFTSTVAQSCLAQNDLPKIIRWKSDNCGIQYKSRDVFGEYQKIASKYDCKMIIYYGAPQVMGRVLWMQ